MTSEKYSELLLMERAEYWAEVLDNVVLGIYSSEEEREQISYVIEFLLNEVENGL